MGRQCKRCQKDLDLADEGWAMCDQETEDVRYCHTCFEGTECGRGDHGEGCPTLVY